MPRRTEMICKNPAKQPYLYLTLFPFFSVFIYSMPGYTCSIKERMLYSSCKNRLLDDVERDYQLEVTKKVPVTLRVKRVKARLSFLKKEFFNPSCFLGCVFVLVDGDRQRRRPHRGLPVWGSPPDGADLKAGLCQASRTGGEARQQAPHQGCRGERGRELKKKKKNPPVFFDLFAIAYLHFTVLRHIERTTTEKNRNFSFFFPSSATWKEI